MKNYFEKIVTETLDPELEDVELWIQKRASIQKKANNLPELSFEVSNDDVRALVKPVVE